MKRATWMWAAALVLAAAWPACDGGGAEEKVCDPGTEVFCRPCPGNPNEPGTKTCNADGTGFDECISRTGQCAVCAAGEVFFCSCDDGAPGEKVCNTDGSGFEPCACSPAGGSGGAGGGTGGGGTGGGAGGGGDKPLFAPCAQDAECESAFCPMGYCTKECAQISDCPFGQAECVSWSGAPFCMPTCKEQLDCEVYGAPSECGYTKAVDDFPVTTCADWLESLELPPDGSGCAQDLDCNLGHEGQERVCAFEACTTGCYEDKDCPVAQACSSMGALGNCQ